VFYQKKAPVVRLKALCGLVRPDTLEPYSVLYWGVTMGRKDSKRRLAKLQIPQRPLSKYAQDAYREVMKKWL